MLQAVEYRIYPTKEQIEYLSKCFGCCRFIYNKMLSDKIDFYKKNKRTLNTVVSQYKTEYDWLKEVDSLALSNTRQDLITAFNNFFKRKDKTKGFPKFKSRKKHKNSYTTNNQDGTVCFVDDKHLKIPKLKTPIKIVKHRTINGEIKSVTIKQKPSGDYFASILFETADKKKIKKNKNKKIGIDLGLKDFVIFSDGTKIENPKIKKSLSDRLTKLQRDLSRTIFKKDENGNKIPSKNHEKLRIKVAKLQQKTQNKRKDFQHKLSKQIIDENQVIVCETLKIENMLKNHNLSDSISDAGWSSFINMLKYKAEWYGREFIQIDTFFASSKTCHNCGYINKDLTLGDRDWVCPICGEHHDRDINAAKNILNEGMKHRRVGTTQIACENLSYKKDIEQEAVSLRAQ